MHHKGKRLDDFFEIGSIKALSDGDTVEIVEGSHGRGVMVIGRRGVVVIKGRDDACELSIAFGGNGESFLLEG